MERGRVFATGLTISLVGFCGTSSVVLAGLQSAGATPGQAASGLAALCLVHGLAMWWMAQRTRMPVALASSLSASMKASEPGLREAAVVTFVVAVSGVTVFDIGAAFWALLAGLAVYAALRIGRR